MNIPLLLIYEKDEMRIFDINKKNYICEILLPIKLRI